MKFRTLMSIVAAVALVAAFAVTASAAQLKLSVVYQTSYHADFSAAGYTLEDGIAKLPGEVAPDDIQQFGLFAELTGAADVPEESLNGILADIVLGPGLSVYGGGSYAAVSPNPSFDPDPPGPLGGGPRGLFTTNADQGAQDLVRIAIQTDQLAAHGLDPGEAGPYELGQFFVQWDGLTTTGLYAAPAASAPADPWALWLGDQPVVGSPTDFARSMNPAGPTMDFDLGGGSNPDIPEPASITLFCLAMIGLVGIRRRRS